MGQSQTSVDAVEDSAITVSTLNAQLSASIESVSTSQYVIGELSDRSESSNGHIYFDLTDPDDDASIDCVVFNGGQRAISLPENGTRVAVDGSVSFYKPRGSVSLVVRDVQELGAGQRAQRRARLKETLQKEGLLDPAAKTALPEVPATVGIVTSPSGSAIEDFSETLRERYPGVDLVVAPTTVQGDGAAAKIVEQIKRLDDQSAIDVIVVTRGGGSDDALWIFNEEPIVRTIARTTTPTCVAIGHEDDVVLADRVADKRAMTPTAAAKTVVPDHSALSEQITQLENRLQAAGSQHVNSCIDRLATDLETTYQTTVEQSLQTKATQLATTSQSHATQTISQYEQQLTRGYKTHVQATLTDLEYDIAQAMKTYEHQREVADLESMAAQAQRYRYIIYALIVMLVVVIGSIIGWVIV